MGETRAISSDPDLGDFTFISSEARQRRVFLFLQGHPSQLWRDLAKTLTDKGHRVEKVHFSVADILFWNRAGGRWFRGHPEEWRGWLEGTLKETGTTDIVYYNDRFPYHRTAMDAGQDLGLRTWCLEFGYLRPDWITLEPGGMGGLSRLRSGCIEQLACLGKTPDMTPLYQHSFATEAWHEVVFNLVQSLTRPLNQKFQADRRLNPVLEYLGWSGHLVRARRDRRDLDRVERDVASATYPYFLVPLQMEGDYQVRSSDYPTMEAFLDAVFSSFSLFRRPTCHLLVKAHPLESGLKDWRAGVRRLARRHGISDCVHFVRGGNLSHFAARSEGLVTLNSTSGLESLRLGRPTVVLGQAVYERPGLTHQSGLDRFWTNPDPVDPRRLSDFLKALSLIQVKGSFYNRKGRKRAVQDLARRMTDNQSRALHRLLPLA